MDVTPLIRKDTQVIQSYSGGHFRVSGTVHKSAVLVTAQETQGWKVQDPAGGITALKEEDFTPIIAQAPKMDVILLGGGARMNFLSPALKAALKGRGVSVDVMDTGAACRTYNVLVAEGRRVMAALLPVL